MALNLVDINEHFSGLTGVFVGQEDNAFFLGEKNKSRLFNAWGIGRIGIGFDTRLSPAQVRIFLDRGDAIVPGTDPEKFYGLIMTREYRFDGLPIPPSVFSPAIAFQDWYSNFISSQSRCRTSISPAYAVSMMSPDLLHENKIHAPYYAYNAACYDADVSRGDAFNLNIRNGFQANIPPSETNNTPLVASLFAPVGLDLDAPPLSFIKQRLNAFKKDGVDPVVTMDTITRENYRQGGLLGKILSTLEITSDDVLKVQMVGQYPLLTLKDAEGYYPVFLLDPDTHGIYSLDLNELDEMQFLQTSDLFERFVDFYTAHGRFNRSFPRRTGYFLRSYGKSNRIATMLSDGTHRIECHYKVYAVGRGSITFQGEKEYVYHCFGGVTWAMRKTFDRDLFKFDNLECTTPTPQELKLDDIVNYNWESYYINQNRNRGKNMPELNNYKKALSSSTTGTIDQNQWFVTYPPVATDITGF